MNYSTSDIDYLNADLVSEPETVYQTNRDLNLARHLMEETACNLFLTGKAGTGKTTFLHHLRQTSFKRIVVLAPTGVAAINAGGATIHSFFQLSFAPFIPGQGFINKDKWRFNFNRSKRRIIAAMDLLVIDEVSMVRPDVLDAIDDLLRRMRNSRLPFGGVQLLLIGDLRQLAPVVREDEWKYLQPYYASPYFFESHALKAAGFLTIELSTIYRQTDRCFIDILNAIREGLLTKEILDDINSRYIPDFTPSEGHHYIRLTTHNRLADEINDSNMARLPGPERVFEAVVQGNFPESSYPADKTLLLKVGAKVMFIKNDRGENRRFYNGMIGTVSQIEDDNVTIIPEEGGEPIVAEAMEWENVRYETDPETSEITTVTDGTFRQLPLRLAWAITIHKSQGLTFERAIVDVESAFAPGQAYVALSRCRSVDSLILGRPLSWSSVITDSTVNNFISEAGKYPPDENLVQTMRAEFLRFCLAELFDFRPIRITFDEFYRYIREYVVPVYPEYYAPFSEADKILRERIIPVSERFASLYASNPIDPEAIVENRAFIDKIRSGCRYFLEALGNVADAVEGVNVKLTNTTYVQRLTNAYDAVSFLLRIKQYILKSMSETDFSVSAYGTAKAVAVFKSDPDMTPVSKKSTGRSHSSGVSPKGAPRKEKEPLEKGHKFSKTKLPKEKRTLGYSRSRSLEIFRQLKNIPEVATERGLVPNTIASHLAYYIAKGDLDPMEIYTPGQFRILGEAADKGLAFGEIAKSCEGEMPPYLVTLYLDYLRFRRTPESPR